MKSHQWIATRKKLLKRIKSEVSDRLGPVTRDLHVYAKKLNREFTGRWRACQLEDLLQSIAQVDVVFGADFHAYSQSQRAHLRLLRSFKSSRPVCLALECLCAEDQPVIEDYLASEITEEEFLKKTEWNTFWGFPWSHYRPMFQLARDKGFQIRGISRKSDLKRPPSLAARDVRMAADIESLVDEGLFVYVLVGELHLAMDHLPKRWYERKPRSTIAILHQDSEALYFRLATQARDSKVEVLRSGPRFCLMVSPPWVKWQSYLMYLEQTYDAELSEDTGDEPDYSDFTKSLIELLAKDFGVEINTNGLQVYTPSSKSSFSKFKRELPVGFRPLLEYCLTRDRSFFLPRSGLVYISHPTLNHTAGSAGRFIHAQMSHQKRPPWDGLKDFDALIWSEAVSFFCSKWINPKRKSETIESLQFQLRALSNKDRSREILLLALDRRLSDVLWVKGSRKRALRMRPRKKWIILEASRILGGILGERLFVLIRSGEIPLSEFVDWLRLPLDGPDFGAFYLQLLKRLK